MTREQFLITLMKYIGIPYIWGSKIPSLGLDCSGLIYNIFKNDLNINMGSVFPVMNAQNYYDLFLEKGSATVIPGSATNLCDLCFFGTSQKIHHIGMALGSSNLMIEAAHGTPSLQNAAQAMLAGAKVEVNPITRLPDLYAILRPNNISFTP